jgi:4-amino-4-deoxy-L-arabinose transferase-like glycosyltransferase
MEASARLLGLSFALAAVAATCGAAAALSRDPDVGLAAAALLASTPLFLKYSATVQRDVASTAFSMLAVWAALVYLRRGRSSALALAAAALALAVYTVAVHVVLLPAAALALAAWRVPVRRAAAASAAFAAACAVPVLLITSRVVGAAHVSFLLDPGRVARNAAWLAAFWLGAGHHSLLLAAIAAWGLERLWRERPREARLLAVCFASYLAFMALHEIPIAYCDQDRHLLYSYPLLAVAAGAGLARLARERPRRAALAAAYLLAAHLALSLGPLDVRRCI